MNLLRAGVILRPDLAPVAKVAGGKACSNRRRCINDADHTWSKGDLLQARTSASWSSSKARRLAASRTGLLGATEEDGDDCRLSAPVAEPCCDAEPCSIARLSMDSMLPVQNSFLRTGPDLDRGHGLHQESVGDAVRRHELAVRGASICKVVGSFGPREYDFAGSNTASMQLTLKDGVPGQQAQQGSPAGVAAQTLRHVAGAVEGGVGGRLAVRAGVGAADHGRRGEAGGAVLPGEQPLGQMAVGASPIPVGVHVWVVRHAVAELATAR